MPRLITSLGVRYATLHMMNGCWLDPMSLPLWLSRTLGAGFEL